MALYLDPKTASEILVTTLVNGGMSPEEARTAASVNAVAARSAAVNGLNGKKGIAAIRALAETLLP